jgi:hypothetical protein
MKLTHLKNDQKKIHGRKNHSNILSIKNKLISLFIIFILTLTILTTISSQNNNELIDTDQDNVPDDMDSDDDNDGFSDEIELQEGTDPKDPQDHPGIKPPDNDGDLIPDSKDVDDDNDGLSDEFELNELGTDPKFMDTDTDFLFDSEELNLGTDPTNKDSDGDGFVDGKEVLANSDPLDPIDYPKKIIANAGIDQIVFPNETVNLDSHLSVGQNLGYSWDFDISDGLQINSGKNKAETTYPLEGIYVVTLTISDGKTFDNDTCRIIVNNSLAVTMDIVKNRKLNSKYYEPRFTLNLIHRDNSSITLEVNGTLKEGVLIAFSVDSYTMMVLEDDKLIVKFDDKIISNVDIIDLVSKNDELPIYNLSRFHSVFQIIIYIPHFSVHTIKIEKIEQEDVPKPIKIPDKDFSNWYLISWLIGAILVFLIVSFAMAYSYKKAEHLKYLKNLKSDDRPNIDFLTRLKNDKINWEDYDSEKAK